MKNEMIERVALAISGGADPKNVLDMHRSRAEAAIKAMLEPTEQMLEAGAWIHPGGEIVGSGAAKEVWQSMIDAIFHD